MCGRAYAPRFLFLAQSPNCSHGWGTVGWRPDIVKRGAAARAGKDVDEMELTMMKTMLQQQIDKESDALRQLGCG